jgi:hypothetical protein
MSVDVTRKVDLVADDSIFNFVVLVLPTVNSAQLLCYCFESWIKDDMNFRILLFEAFKRFELSPRKYGV